MERSDCAYTDSVTRKICIIARSLRVYARLYAHIRAYVCACLRVRVYRVCA